jgi:membrane fusion protein (multidrug efflux system)
MDKRKKILSVVGAIAVLVVAYFTYNHLTYVSTDNAQIDAHAVLLAPKVSGYILKVNVVEGQKVKKGDSLVEIDPRDFENSIKQVSGDLSSLEARRRDAERQFRRISELYSKEAVSQQQYDQASAAYNEVKAKHEAVAAQVAQAQINLENSKILAPSNGFVAKKSAEVGQLAAPGVPLIGFIDGGSRWVTANFKETEISDIHPGNKADIEVDAVDGESFHGVVESISSATGSTFTLLPPDNATGNFTKVVQRVPVRIRMENLNDTDIEKLRAGLSAVVKVHKH